MATARQDVMDAIMNIIRGMTFSTPINNVSTWATAERRLRLWGDVPPEAQPAVYLVTHREMDEYTGLGLLRRRLELGAWCYAKTGAPATSDIVGGEILDTMLEAFEAAFIQPDDFSTNENTLGGLVYWCRIEGRVLKDPGDIDDQAMMIVPIVVEMP